MKIMPSAHKEPTLRFNPFYYQDLISNSPYRLLYNLYYISSENLVLDQLITPLLIFFFILLTYLFDSVSIWWGEILFGHFWELGAIWVARWKWLKITLVPLYHTFVIGLEKMHQLFTNQMPKQKSQLGHLFCFPIGLLGFPEFSLVHFDIHLWSSCLGYTTCNQPTCALEQHQVVSSFQGGVTHKMTRIKLKGKLRKLFDSLRVRWPLIHHWIIFWLVSLH